MTDVVHKMINYGTVCGLVARPGLRRSTRLRDVTCPACRERTLAHRKAAKARSSGLL